MGWKPAKKKRPLEPIYYPDGMRRGRKTGTGDPKEEEVFEPCSS